MLSKLFNKESTMPNTFIFIDGSYFCFYRYHSLLTWWKNAFPNDNLDDPYQNEIFVEKFKKTFVEHVSKIPQNLKIPNSINPITIVGKDCKKEDIWRQELYPNYKANRVNDGFMGKPFFKMVYDDNLFGKGGASAILKHPKLEADDCIAISVKFLLQKYKDCTIYIITSDKDYLQLAEPRVHLYNLGYKKLTEQKSCLGNAELDLFVKILTGDPSDNITSVFPKCGPKTAIKYFENKELFNKKISESNECKEKYELNKKIIDFNEIPKNLVQEFMQFVNTN
jgi:5'-3' exonuclease